MGMKGCFADGCLHEPPASGWNAPSWLLRTPYTSHTSIMGRECPQNCPKSMRPHSSAEVGTLDADFVVQGPIQTYNALLVHATLPMSRGPGLSSDEWSPLQDLTSHVSSTYNDESLAWYHVWPYNCATLYTLKIRTWDAIMTRTIDSNDERCYQDLSSTGARILPIVARLVNHLEIFGRRRVFFCILIPAILWYYVTCESQVFTCLFHGTFHMRPKPISNQRLSTFNPDRQFVLLS